MAVLPALFPLVIFGLDGNGIRTRIHADLLILKLLLIFRALDRVHFDFIPATSGDVNRAIDILQFHTAVGIQRIGVMELLSYERLVVRSIGACGI